MSLKFYQEEKVSSFILFSSLKEKDWEVWSFRFRFEKNSDLSSDIKKKIHSIINESTKSVELIPTNTDQNVGDCVYLFRVSLS